MNLNQDIEVLRQMARQQPAEAARVLARAFRQALEDNDRAELVRLADVVKELAELLTPEFSPLLFYACAIAKWTADDITGAIDEFRRLRNSVRTFRPGCYSVTLSKRHGCLKITNVLLDMPPEIFARISEIFRKVNYEALPETEA